jgi:hypothetical protein
MVTSIVLALLMAAAVSAFTFYTKSAYKLTNQGTMNAEGRFYLTQMAQDLRSAIDVTKATNNEMWLTLEDPDEVQSTVKYTYSNDDDTLSRQVVGASKRTLINDVTWMQFYYYDSQNNSSSNILDMKRIDVTFKLQPASIGFTTPEVQYKSARFTLRNRVPQ